MAQPFCLECGAELNATGDYGFVCSNGDCRQRTLHVEHAGIRARLVVRRSALFIPPDPEEDPHGQPDDPDRAQAKKVR